MKNIPSHVWVVAGIGVLLIGGIAYVVDTGLSRFERISSEISDLGARIAALESELATTTASLGQNIEKTRAELIEELEREKKKSAELKSELSVFKQDVGDISQKVGSVTKEVGQVSGKVSTLEKLSKTDPELLQKYSKVFFLNEHYVPERLVEIPNKYKYFESRTMSISAQVWPYLQRMLEAAEDDGIPLYVFSAYRSFEEQRYVKGRYTVTYGEGTANQFSADQGYSEHQLGTTVDLMTLDIGGSLDAFEGTEAYQWVLDNAHKYGFILSYPEDNEYYIFEPWHWRFVGVKLATDLHESGRNFYDLEQREIDEYLVNIFE